MTNKDFESLKVGDAVSVDAGGWRRGIVTRVEVVRKVTVRYRNGSICECSAEIIYPQQLRTVAEQEKADRAYERFYDSIPKYGTVPICKDGQHKWHITCCGAICTKCGDTDKGD